MWPSQCFWNPDPGDSLKGKNANTRTWVVLSKKKDHLMPRPSWYMKIKYPPNTGINTIKSPQCTLIHLGLCNSPEHSRPYCVLGDLSYRNKRNKLHSIIDRLYFLNETISGVISAVLCNFKKNTRTEKHKHESNKSIFIHLNIKHTSV